MNRVALMDEKTRIELATYYTDLIAKLGLSNSFIKSTEIAAKLNISEREWRKHVENIMNLYMYGNLEKMIIGTSNGYTYTGDGELINQYLYHKEKQFKSMAYNCYNLKKAVLRKSNLTIDEYLKTASE